MSMKTTEKVIATMKASTTMITNENENVSDTDSENVNFWQ